MTTAKIGSLLALRVWGDYACFTRPELKVERVSYPVMTPSAARGVLEAIFWHPQMRWQVEEIWVLKPIRYYSILRNEVTKRADTSRAIVADRPDTRAQRHTLALRDVDYLIRARVELLPGVDHHIAKYQHQFRRRLQRGQCFTTPYFGCREFSVAGFSPARGDERRLLIQQSGQLGPMLLDLNYYADCSGRGEPIFFPAALNGGILRYPRRPIKEGLDAATEPRLLHPSRLQPRAQTIHRGQSALRD